MVKVVGLFVLVSILAVACGGDEAGKAGSSNHAPDGSAPADGGASGSGGSSGGISGAAGTPAGGAGGAGGSGPDGNQFWKDFSTALCHHYLHCRGENYGGIDLRVMGGEAECSAALVKSIATRPHTAALTRAVASGSLKIRSDAVAACLAAAASCYYPLLTAPRFEIQIEDITPCREVFEGTVPAGGDCDASEECAGDSMCLTSDATAPTACSGTCVARRQVGEACTIHRQCAASSPSAWPICDDTKKCLVVTVDTPAAEGEYCHFVDAELKPCGDDLWCPGSTFGRNSDTCRKPLPVGNPCDLTIPSGGECIQGHCYSNTCTVNVISNQVGDPCGSTGELCNSLKSLACDSNDKCVVSDGSPGAVCQSSYWYQTALCPLSAGSADGAPCTSHDSCASGVCSFGHGCVPKFCSAR